MNFLHPHPHDLQWHSHQEKSGIHVQWAAVNNSSFKAIRGEMTVQAPIEQCVNFIKDTKNMRHWIDGCILSEQYEFELDDIEPADIKPNSVDSNTGGQNQAQFIGQLIFGLPWPLKNVISTELNTLTWSSDKKRALLHYQSAKPQHPSEKQHLKKCLPMAHTEGVWIMECLDNGYSRIAHAGFADPGGKIPAALANNSALSSQAASFLALRKQLEIRTP